MSEHAGLGAMLRECRETKGLSLDDLSRDTRISLRALLALEEDRFRDLPAPIFVRGFIRAYCTVVGEPPERALAFYDSASGAPRGPSAVPRAAALVQAPARRPGLALRGRAAKLGMAGALVVVGGVAYLFVSGATPEPDRARPAATALSPAAAPREPAPVVVPAASTIEAPIATPASASSVHAAPAPMPAAPAAPAAAPVARAAAPVATATAPVATATAPVATATAPAPIVVAPAPAPKAPATPPAPAPAPAPAARPAIAPRTHVLVARAHEATWVLVRAADGVASQETLEPGSVREWQSAGRFTVTVGNAGGLTLELDGVALPPLGEQGQVVRDVRLPREPTP
jgi:cytoskeletal protein RodZ